LSSCSHRCRFSQMVCVEIERSISFHQTFVCFIPGESAVAHCSGPVVWLHK
jgi:hypothetical protein